MSERLPFGTPFLVVGDPALQDEEKRAALYRSVFGTANGRLVLADILMRGGVAAASFEPGAKSEDGWFNSGVHAYALSIAQTAGLNLGLLGRAMIEGVLETMMVQHDDRTDDD